MAVDEAVAVAVDEATTEAGAEIVAKSTAGSWGVSTSPLLGRAVPLACEIMDRNQKGMLVHNLPEVQ